MLSVTKPYAFQRKENIEKLKPCLIFVNKIYFQPMSTHIDDQNLSDDVEMRPNDRILNESERPDW